MHRYLPLLILAGLVSFQCNGCVGGVTVKEAEKQKEISENDNATKTVEMGNLPDHSQLQAQIELANSQHNSQNEFSIYTAPIILVHGLSGFVNVGPVEYFNGVKDHLSQYGHRVYATKTDPFGSIESRGAQLKIQIEQYLDSIQAPKAILICHSMGGLDARWMASPQGGNSSRVAVIVTIGTPHRGTQLADWALSVAPSSVESLLNHALTSLGLAPRGIEKLEALKDLTAERMKTFNQTYLNNSAVKYYSISGTQSKLTGMNLALWAPYDIIWLKQGANDGLVPMSSAKWGHFLGDVAADHADQIGLLTLWNHLEFYKNLVTYVIANYTNSSYKNQYSNY